jgi:hypothetical protein
MRRHKAGVVVILQQLMQRDQLAEGRDSLNAGRPLDSRRWNDSRGSRS